MADDFERRVDEHRRRIGRRLAALKAANRALGRDHLRGLRRVARPRLIGPSRRRWPALALFVLAVVVLLALWLVERADGAYLGGIPMLNLSSRRAAIVLAFVLCATVVVVVADAKGGDRVDRLSQPQLERASIRAVVLGGVHSTRYGAASPWLRRLSRELVDRAFRGDARRWARCVVERESGMNPGAISSTGDYGLAQVNRASHRWPSYRRMLVDPPYAVAVMVRLSNGGRSRGPWRGGSHAC